jgi:C4-dicarboxylate-specific signal transduction histidine kinase
MKHDDPDLQEVVECLQDIVADSKRAGNVVRRLRAMVKKEPLRRQQLNVSTLIDEVSALLSNEIILRQATLSTSRAPDLPDVAGDSVQLQQVILNLVINGLDAVRENPPDQRRVTLSSGPGANGGVELIASDTGTGIPKETLPRIFQPFFTTKQKGMGVGLSVCKTIIDAHGGTLTATNLPEGGAQFTIWLPPAGPDTLNIEGQSDQ